MQEKVTRRVAISAALIAAAAVCAPAAAHHSALPHGRAVTVHSLMGAIVNGETITIDGRTYVARRVSP
jgi:hypothetical protein